jgi:hypothetical protein
MLCHDWAAVAPALEAVAQAISDRTPDTGRETEPHTKVDPRLADQSRARIERLRHRLREIEKTDALPLDVIGCPENRALAAEIRARINKANA